MIYSLVICVCVIILDAVSKYLVVANIPPDGNVPCINGVFHLTYIKNRGAAFGMLENARWVFLIVSVIAIVAMIVYMLLKKPKNMWVKTAIAMLVGGGIGNMIDRVRLGYVVDFIEVDFVDFAVFNVADSFVTVACGILVVYLIVASVKEEKAKKAVAEEKEENE